jgi:hypothetical protein
MAQILSNALQLVKKHPPEERAGTQTAARPRASATATCSTEQVAQVAVAEVEDASGATTTATTSAADLDDEKPAKKKLKPAKKKLRVTFGVKTIRYFKSYPKEHIAEMGSVGETDAFLLKSNNQLTKKTCAPISASRLVQRRWRSSAASGRR